MPPQHLDNLTLKDVDRARVFLNTNLGDYGGRRGGA